MFEFQSEVIAEYTKNHKTVLEDIIKERIKQDAQWGGPSHDDKHDASDFFGFITDQIEKFQVDEQNADVCDATYRERMIKIAALAVAAVQSLDRHTQRTQRKS